MERPADPTPPVSPSCAPTPFGCVPVLGRGCTSPGLPGLKGVPFGRRSLLRGAGLGAAGLLLAGGAGLPRPARAQETRLLGYAFGTARKEVTVFDTATLAPLGTHPLGVTVRWLSNEQRYLDGSAIWTYDFPDNEVRAIAIDQRLLTVQYAVPTGGVGPAHSLMLTPDLSSAWLNNAGSNSLSVVDTERRLVIGGLETGEFP